MNEMQLTFIPKMMAVLPLHWPLHNTSIGNVTFKRALDCTTGVGVKEALDVEICKQRASIIFIQTLLATMCKI
jgi:hypothetical protein